MSGIYKDPSLPKRKKANPLEKAIEKAVCDHAKELGFLVYKFTSPARRSVPDRLFIPPRGLPAFFIEFKRRGEKPTEGQATEIAKIVKQGTRVFVIDNKETGRMLISQLAAQGIGNAVCSAVTMADPFF